MTERETVARAALDALTLNVNQEALLVTVVRVGGSTYRRPGARMLLMPDKGSQSRVAGSISGGCLEGDLVKKAWWRTENGPIVLTYDSTITEGEEGGDSEEISWGFGLGCNGIVEVLLERITPDSIPYLTFLRDQRVCRQAGVLATVIKNNGNNATISIGSHFLFTSQGFPNIFFAADAAKVLESKQSTWLTYEKEGENIEVFFEYLAPPQPLIIFGAGHDVQPIVKIANTLLGWHVTVVDTRSAQPHPERFPEADSVLTMRPEKGSSDLGDLHISPETVTLLMTHHYPDDEKLLGLLLESPAPYVGVLGPKRRTERLLAALPALPAPEQLAKLTKLYAPMGLDMGADNPEEIALAILGEVRAILAGRTGGFLRDRSAPIHLPAPTSFLSHSKEPITCALASD